MRRYAPVMTLFFLAPFIAEVLFGATPVSNLGALIMVVPLYGCGVLLIREIARRWKLGWGRIALLGAAYALIEEGLAIGSLSNPDLFNAGLLGGRWLGVNWVWTEWTVGYHIVWSVCVPIVLAELLFPDRRAEPWLGRLGIGIAGLLYTLGVLAIGATYRFVLTPQYRAPLAVTIAVVLAVIVLAALALTLPRGTVRESARATTAGHPPSPWIVGLLATVCAAFLFSLLLLPHPLRRDAWPLLPMVFVIGLVLGTSLLIRRWSARPTWSDLHRLALAIGPLPISMAFGVFAVARGRPIDQLAQAVLGIGTLTALALLAWRFRRRSGSARATTSLVHHA